MALYHFHVSRVLRSRGQSSVEAAAYRAGEKLEDRYYGKIADYTAKDGVICAEIMAPDYVPKSFHNREYLWNAVEEVEKHPKAQLAYSFDFALQNEFTMEENIAQFGLNNVKIIDHVDDETMKDMPVPDVTMLVASATMEKEIETLLKINPKMEFVIYTLDFKVAAELRDLLSKYKIGDFCAIQVQVSKLKSNNSFEIQPAPWIITGVGEAV